MAGEGAVADGVLRLVGEKGEVRNGDEEEAHRGKVHVVVLRLGRRLPRGAMDGDDGMAAARIAKLLEEDERPRVRHDVDVLDLRERQGDEGEEQEAVDNIWLEGTERSHEE